MKFFEFLLQQYVHYKKPYTQTTLEGKSVLFFARVIRASIEHAHEIDEASFNYLRL